MGCKTPSRSLSDSRPKGSPVRRLESAPDGPWAGRRAVHMEGTGRIDRVASMALWTSRLAFSLVEICMAIGILIVLSLLTVVVFDDLVGTSKERAARQDLDVIRKGVLLWQVERRSDYPHEQIPPHEGVIAKDPWGHPYRVRPRSRIIYSAGPNGTDEQGAGDDLSTAYESYIEDELRPPPSFRVVEHGPDWLRLGWDPVRYRKGVAGYNVYRRESVGQTTYATIPIHPSPIPSTQAPQLDDTGLMPGTVYYYSLEVLGTNGERARYPGQLGYQLPASTTVVQVSVTPSTLVLTAGSTSTFAVTARSAGGVLKTLEFDGVVHPLSSSSHTLSISKRFVTAGLFDLEVVATDESGQTGKAKVRVEVQDQIKVPGTRF